MTSKDETNNDGVCISGKVLVWKYRASVFIKCVKGEKGPLIKNFCYN